MGGKVEEAVSVVVRCRPLNPKELRSLDDDNDDLGRQGCVRVSPDLGLVEIQKSSNSKSFTFDAVYDANSRQEDLYEETFAPLVDSVLSGFNGTIFAYGQTGTGKTFTMEGAGNSEGAGVIPRSFQQIFKRIEAAGKDEEFLVRASYLEIYQEEVRDLLQNSKACLELRERPDTGVYVKDLSTFVCKSRSEIEHVMSVGKVNRTVGATNMNEHSSRSHAIFIVTVECSKPDPETGEPHIRVGKLNLVDLAGSERQAKTGATGERLKEATKINLSLSALGNVISALVDGKSAHIPYRDSKLTRLLQDSLGGNARTVMVANVGPAASNYEETLTTLRYASRAKNIKNKPRINEDPKDAMLREFQEEIARLKSQLTNRMSKSAKRRKSAAARRSKDVSDSVVLSDSTESQTSLSPSVSAERVDEGSTLASSDELEGRLAIERELLEADTGMLANEKKRLLQQLSAKESALKEERRERTQVLERIRALESKLLKGHGDVNMIERTNEQQRVLEKRRADLAERRKAEMNAAEQLEASEEQGEELEKTYTNLQQEVESKTRKLRKLFGKLQSVKQDILDVTEEYNRDRRDLEDTQQQLLKELKLKTLVIENFIPPAERKKLLSRVYYDEEDDNWKSANLVGGGGAASSGSSMSSSADASSLPLAGFVISKRPVSAVGSRRPVSEYARMVAGLPQNQTGVTRYRGENIMRLNLDRGGRTTRDYEGPQVAPRVQAALDAAMLNVEPDIEVDVSALNSRSAVRGMMMMKKRQKASSRKSYRMTSSSSHHTEKRYPSSRGLVPK